MGTKCISGIFIFAFILVSFSFAQDRSDATGSTDSETSKAIPEEQSSITQHSVVVAGETVHYTATAATMHLKNDDGEVIGSLYYTAYTRDGADSGMRPVSFIYNGGPGSASMWLHMGAFGPKRVRVSESEPTPPPPYDLINSEGTLIDETDMVFIDPIGTGFSRVVGKGEGTDFWGIDEDARSLTNFISQYVTRNDRWNSPKYLIGESYGTTRSAVLVNRLQNQAGMQFNGVVLISSVLDFETLMFSAGSDVSYVTFLPTYAITAAYHGITRWPDNLESWLDDVREFAIGDYAAVLARGASASPEKFAAVRTRLAELTGLSEEFLDRAHLRVTASQFRAELQRNESHITSRLDARYDGYTNQLLAENASYDPQSTAITGAYTAAVNRYLREELGYKTTDTYKGSGGTSNWNWNRQGNSGGWQSAANVAPDLEQAMIRNPNLKVEFENGYYDLATPFYATEWTTDHMILPEALRGNIEHKFYEAGHMMYVIKEELLALRHNITTFIKSTSGSAAPKH